MNAYDTLSQRPYKKIVENIKEAFDKSRVLKDDDFIRVGGSYAHIYKIAPGMSGIPQWNLPIPAGPDDILVDTRMFERADGRVTKQYEINYIYNRAVMASQWHYNRDNFEVLLDPLTIIYSEWLINMTTSRFVLNETQKVGYQFFYAFYYWVTILGQRNIEMMTEDDIMMTFSRFCERKMRMLRPTITEIMQSESTIELIKKIHEWKGNIGIKFFLEAANRHVDSLAAEVDLSVLYNFAFSRGSWFGEAADDIVAVALEYPPMLAHCAYLAATRSTYKNTQIGRAVDTVHRRIFKLDGLVRWTKMTMDDYGLGE